MMYDELIKNLRGRSQFLLPHYGEETSYDSDLMKQAADAIEKLTDRNVGKWIPVTERLPEENGNYLVAVKCPRGKWVEICACDGRDWVSVDEYAEYATKWVTHWMPLPTPPQAEEGET